MMMMIAIIIYDIMLYYITSCYIVMQQTTRGLHGDLPLLDGGPVGERGLRQPGPRGHAEYIYIYIYIDIYIYMY